MTNPMFGALDTDETDDDLVLPDGDQDSAGDDGDGDKDGDAIKDDQQAQDADAGSDHDDGADDEGNDKPKDREGEQPDPAKAEVEALHKSRDAARAEAREAKAELARMKAEAEAAKVKPDPFAEQAELESLQTKVNDPNEQLDASEAKRYGELMAARTRHDADQSAKADAAKRQAADNAVVDASLSAAEAEHDDFAALWEIGINLLTKDDRAAIKAAGAGAGEKAYGLLKTRVASSRDRLAKVLGLAPAADSATNKSTKNNKNGAAESDDNDADDLVSDGPQTMADFLAGG